MSEIKRNGHGAMDMTQGSPTRLIVLFSLPLLAGNVLQQLYNMVDSVVVGNYVGSSALTAVGAGFSIMFLISSLFLGFSMGATIMIAQYVGAGDQGAVGRTVDTIYSALLVIIVPLTLLGVLASGPLLTLIRVPQEAYEQARTYCMVVLGGIIGTLGYNMNSGIMRGLGDSRTPLIFLFIACVINIVLDLVFVLVFSWGVFGVALATILAQICSWVFGIFYINRKYPFLHIRLFRMRLDRRLLGQVIRLGIPSAIQECQFAVGILIMQALINGFGNDFAAGFTAANKIDTFAFMPIESFSIAATTYVGQNMGAGRLDRVQTGTRRALVLGTLVCLAMSAVVLPLRRPLLMLFNREPGVVAARGGIPAPGPLPDVHSGHDVYHERRPPRRRRHDSAHGSLHHLPLGGPHPCGLCVGLFLRPGGDLLGLSHRLGPGPADLRGVLLPWKVEGQVHCEPGAAGIAQRPRRSVRRGLSCWSQDFV